MDLTARIFVAGHRGLVGSAIVRRLQQAGFTNLITRARQELDLTDATAVLPFFQKERPEYVFLAAARVGGILANNAYPADFIRENLAIQANVIHGAYLSGVRKLLFLGSSCIYPKLCPQPIREEYLLTGPLEPTNAPYAVAKIAGIQMCQAYNRQCGTNYISVMPTNLYGPGDNFDPQSSHVLPALIRKFHEARINRQPRVEIWGTGTPRREFLYVDDLAEASLFLMDRYNESEVINVGTGEDLPIRELAGLIQQVTGYEGELRFNPDKPDGTPRKLLDIRRIKALGWTPRVTLREGIEATYRYFLQTHRQGGLMQETRGEMYANLACRGGGNASSGGRRHHDRLDGSERAGQKGP